MASRRPARPLLRAAALTLGTLALLELGAALLLRHAPGFTPREEIQTALSNPSPPQPAAAAEAEGSRTRARGGHNVLHPYLGFVRSWDPSLRNEVNRRVVDLPVNELGFFGPAPPGTRDPSILTIAVSGGSVAAELFLYGRDALRAAFLEAAGESLRGRRVEIVSLALGGMKQPQQLMALNYLLALGHHVDMVINLDGLNEVALPVLELDRFDTFYAYPSRWRFHASGAIDLESAQLVGRIDAERTSREGTRQLFSNGVLSRSAFALALWHGLERRSRAREDVLEAALATRLSDTRADLQATGPPNRFTSRGEMLKSAAALWRRSSLQMAQLCAANGIAYHHFLQPSQYVDGSKPFTARERQRALGPDNGFAAVGVRLGYPLLLVAGQELDRHGVHFVDLTGVFRDQTRNIYRDDCCHLT